ISRRLVQRIRRKIPEHGNRIRHQSPNVRFYTSRSLCTLVGSAARERRERNRSTFFLAFPSAPLEHNWRMPRRADSSDLVTIPHHAVGFFVPSDDCLVTLVCRAWLTGLLVLD